MKTSSLAARAAARLAGARCLHTGSAFKHEASPSNHPNLGSFILNEIGQARSPFMQRAGTPRQGLLVPSSLSCIEFKKSKIPAEALFELDRFSHAWVIFRFHVNVSRRTKHRNSENQGFAKDHEGFTAKVTPPRAGRKVGVLATRSPHRPNPIVDNQNTSSWLISGQDLQS